MSKVTRRWLVYPNTIPWITINNSRQGETFDTTRIDKYFITGEDGKVKCYTQENDSRTGRKFYMSTYSPDEEKEGRMEFPDEDSWGQEFDETDADKVSKSEYSFMYNEHQYRIYNFRKPNNIGIVEVAFDNEEEAKDFNPDFWLGPEITKREDYTDLSLAKNAKKFFIEIVLTGGPCGGKSTALASLKNMFEGLGYKVLTSSEVASDIIGSGAHPAQVPSYSFQRVMVQAMLAKEENMRILAYEYFQREKDNDKPVIIFYDREIPDNSAYCDPMIWRTILTELGLTSEDLNHLWDGVIDIVTTAYGAEDVYLKQKGNNPARDEGPEQARFLEDRIQQAYAACNNFMSIQNTKGGWPEKLNNIINAVRIIVGLSSVISQNRRVLVKIPQDMQAFMEKYNCVVQEIEQIYFPSDNPLKEHRIRKIGIPGNWAYYEAEKEIMPDGQISTIQRMIDKDKYITLAKLADPTRDVLRKKRYSFAFNGLQYNLDVFDDEFTKMKGKGLLGLKGRDVDITEPDEIVPEELKKGINISELPFFEYQLASNNTPVPVPILEENEGQDK